MIASEGVDFGGERVLGEVGRKKRQRGVSGVAGGGLKERENVIERAARGMRKERVKDRGSLRNGSDE